MVGSSVDQTTKWHPELNVPPEDIDSDSVTMAGNQMIPKFTMFSEAELRSSEQSKSFRLRWLLWD